jgi:mono/diheme cytochrome c family protein
MWEDHKVHIHKVMVLIVLSFTLAACGANNDQVNNGADQPTQEVPTTFPTFAFNAPTEAPAVATAAARAATDTAEAAESGELDPVAVERGLGRFEALECGACHGAAGEGTDSGPSLLTFAQSQDAFISFMRSGGDMGDDHRFPAERLSNSGIANLYQYLRSLEQQEQ